MSHEVKISATLSGIRFSSLAFHDFLCTLYVEPEIDYDNSYDLYEDENGKAHCCVSFQATCSGESSFSFRLNEARNGKEFFPEVKIIDEMEEEVGYY